jgi:hypothetical protein
MCGGGTDTYLPDYGDYQQLAPIDSCEDVTVPPDPLHSLIPSPAAAAAAKTAWLGVRCPFSGSGICAGRLRLISTRRPARELAVGRLRLAPGSTATVELRLAPAARKALAHERTLKARAVVSTGSAGKDFKLPGSVTLRRKHR